MKQITFSKTVENIRNLLKSYILNSNLKSLIVGVSGGIDSALVCALVKPVVDELGIELIGRYISIQTNKDDERKRAIKIGEEFCTDFKEIDLTDKYLVMREIDDIESEGDEGLKYKIRMGNIKARMRMIYLYNLANRNDGMVLSTDNYTEYNLGFWTLAGDIGDYGIIQQLWKTEVYNISEWLSLNGTNSEKEALTLCIDADATDGLGISNTDLDQILPDWKQRHSNTRSGYKEVDEIIESYFKLIEKLNSKISQVDKSKLIDLINTFKESPVIQRYFKTEFKRNNPYIVKRENYIEY